MRTPTSETFTKEQAMAICLKHKGHRGPVNYRASCELNVAASCLGWSINTDSNGRIFFGTKWAEENLSSLKRIEAELSADFSKEEDHDRI